MSFIPIANYEDKYHINDKGLVLSKINNNLLVPRTNPNGYLIVSLEKSQLSIHRLVALHFIPNPYGYDQVNHKDGDKTNNQVDNLEWCSCSQNAQHALKTGLRKGYVSYDTKLEFLNRTLNGEIISDLAKELGNHPNTLSRMLRETAKKENRELEWSLAMKERRRNAAIRNLPNKPKNK